MTFYDHIDDFSNSMKGSSSKGNPAGLYLGKVVRVSGGIYISIPSLAPGSTFGPCKTFGTYPVIGQSILCGFLDGKFNEPVVIGKSTQSKVLKDVDTPVDSTDGSNKLYVDNQIANLLSYVNAQLATKANTVHGHN
jgi:hypothetical protein